MLFVIAFCIFFSDGVRATKKTVHKSYAMSLSGHNFFLFDLFFSSSREDSRHPPCTLPPQAKCGPIPQPDTTQWWLNTNGEYECNLSAFFFLFPLASFSLVLNELCLQVSLSFGTIRLPHCLPLGSPGRCSVSSSPPLPSSSPSSCCRPSSGRRSTVRPPDPPYP